MRPSRKVCCAEVDFVLRAPSYALAIEDRVIVADGRAKSLFLRDGRRFPLEITVLSEN